MFNKILIANRGEIACRIIKTARSMGIHSVAIYSKIDKNSLHVHMADSAYCVGEATAAESYLNIRAIIDAAVQSQVQAIHPGYGFLSENPQFAAACAEAGLIFIGPNVDAMTLMASKQQSKLVLESSTIPLTPGYHGLEQEETYLLDQAKRIGFPVLIKAANGGGGKGMRAVYNEDEFISALEAAKRESLSSFADECMILEKLVLNPRHIELQIMADNYGNVVHLFERDCSIQRRHQKIIEEGPASNLSSTLRQQLADTACQVARLINYRGAGTVEFLVGEDEQFYFMEMNTRLQVEHPVTELITGYDLVSWQLKIASGEKIPVTQEQIKASGHAIECRIYAEDPTNDFLPSIGTIKFLHEPRGDGIRIDSGVGKDSSISRYYDPMVSKLIVWGQDRPTALLRLQQALKSYFIGGIKTNIAFLQQIVAQKTFIDGSISTSFLNNQTIELPTTNSTDAWLCAACYDFLSTKNKMNDPLFQESLCWQSLSPRTWVSRFINGTGFVEVQIKPVKMNHWTIYLLDKQYEVEAHLHCNKLSVIINNKHYTSLVEEHAPFISIYGLDGQFTVERYIYQATINNEAITKEQLIAPMPSTVIKVLINNGQSVKKGQALIILEAMKMEHTLHAPYDGTVQEVFFTEGDQVMEGKELLILAELNTI